uniref:Uncharacterized protein n=1 Tax=Anopheles atroparvus TaxID=41427 RepID=A0AAG5CN72_ANOAO
MPTIPTKYLTANQRLADRNDVFTAWFYEWINCSKQQIR